MRRRNAFLAAAEAFYGGNYHHRAWRLPHHCRADASHQDIMDESVPVRAHNDQIGLQAGDFLQDFPDRLADAGWKALVRNLSDIAAMGGTPRYAVAAVSGAGTDALLAIHGGLEAAARTYS